MWKSINGIIQGCPQIFVVRQKDRQDRCALPIIIPEKIQTGGLEDREFAGVLKKKHVEIPVVN